MKKLTLKSNESGKSQLEKVLFLVEIEFFSSRIQKKSLQPPKFFYLKNSSTKRKPLFLVQIYLTQGLNLHPIRHETDALEGMATGD